MYSLTILMSIALLLCSYSYPMEKPQEKRSLTFLENSLIGASAGACEVTIVGQMLQAIKNRLQAGTHTSASDVTNKTVMSLLKQLYKGYGVNVASMAPITAIQVGTNGLLSPYLNGSDTQKTGAAFIAGATSALASSPADMLVIQQGHVVKDTLSRTLKEIFDIHNPLSYSNLKKLFRGLTPTAIRDGGFTIGYITLGDILKRYLGIDTGSHLGDAITTGIPAGLVAGTLTHPFDTISTALKRDLSKKLYKNSLDAAVNIAREKGTKELFKGLTPRTTRIAAAIPLLSYVKATLEEHLK